MKRTADLGPWVSRLIHCLGTRYGCLPGAFLIVFTIACNPGASSVEEDPTQTLPMEKETTILAGIQPASSAGSLPVAVVNGHLVYRRQIEQKIQVLLEGLEGRITPDALDRTRAEIAPKAFDQLVLEIRLTDYAHEQDLAVPPGATITDAAIQHFASVLPDPSDKQVADYLAQHLARYVQEGKVRTFHLFLRVQDWGDTAATNKTRKEAESLLARIASGESFSEVARKYSDDAESARHGGDLGFVGRGQSLPVLERAIFSMKPGETSDVIQSQFGFHILHVPDPLVLAAHDLQQERVGQWAVDLVKTAEISDYAGGTTE